RPRGPRSFDNLFSSNHRHCRLPTRLGHSRNFAAQGQVAKAYPAELELPQVSSRTTTALAAVVAARRKLRLALRFCDHACLCHEHPRPISDCELRIADF